MLFLEVFAGAGGLSAALCREGLSVETPIEAHPEHGYIKEFDLLEQTTFDWLLVCIERGSFKYVHFGLPCSSWSIIQRLNGGTRTEAAPEGSGHIQKECVGHLLAIRVAVLRRALHAVGSWFSIENPDSSYVWKFGPVSDFLDVAIDVRLDQCRFGLVPPHVSAESNLRIKKPTRIRTNLVDLKVLGRTCEGGHQPYRC